MEKFTHTSAIIFDFDGVLADAESFHAAALRATLREVGLDVSDDDYLKHFLGVADREAFVSFFELSGRKFTRAETEYLLERKRKLYAATAATLLYPGVASVVTELAKNFLLAIASGSYRDEIEPVLRRGGILRFFTAIVGVDEVAHGKPAPDLYLNALTRLRRVNSSLVAKNCVVVEDSPYGITAARAAGLPCIAVTNSHPAAALSAADKVISDIRELISLFL